MTQDDSPGQALSLLDGLYDGITTPENWSPAIRRIGTALGGVGVSIVTHHKPTSRLSITDEEALPSGLAEGFLQMNDVDPARAAVPLLASGGVYIDHDFHGAASLRRMSFYRNFLNPHGIGHYALLPAGSDMECLHVLSVLRETDRQAFNAHERSLMHAVQPHLRHALNLRHQMNHWQQRARRLEDALDTLSFPLIACSVQGTVAMVNATGRQWLKQADCPLGKTPPPLPLRQLLAQACGYGVDTPRAGSLILPDASVLIALPFAPKADAGPDALALLAIQGERWRPLAPGAMLRTLFGLTPAEIRLVHHLASHDVTLAAVSDQWGLSQNTLRTQLQAVFKKTHTSRQSDLLRLVGELGLIRPADKPSPE